MRQVKPCAVAPRCYFEEQKVPVTSWKGDYRHRMDQMRQEQKATVGLRSRAEAISTSNGFGRNPPLCACERRIYASLTRPTGSLKGSDRVFSANQEQTKAGMPARRPLTTNHHQIGWDRLNNPPIVAAPIAQPIAPVNQGLVTSVIGNPINASQEQADEHQDEKHGQVDFDVVLDFPAFNQTGERQNRTQLQSNTNNIGPRSTKTSQRFMPASVRGKRST